MIKYALINGDHGVICTVDLPIYGTKVNENIVFFCFHTEVRPKLDGKDCWEKLTFIYLQDQIPMLLGDVEECIKLLRQ
ncbi:unnamed protein product [Rotaria sp. Silwood1]|nr:unnamed protein product [Rotaria sp. Silwood1]CAF1686211.1 unnamed protein product [Rotaria sp. Silwood1]